VAEALEVCRIVESQSRLYAEQATSSYEKALYLESILEQTKPPLPAEGWHPLIATPFRYPLPVAPPYQARFRPPFFHKNVLYASGEFRTILYEHAFHYLMERVHLQAVREAGQRTAFTLFITSSPITDLHREKDWKTIMDRRDYAPSHAYIRGHLDTEVLRYPSCRDPQQGDNFAVFDIRALARHLGKQETVSFYFDPLDMSIVWMDYRLRITWKEVS
jgi:hypothetical protein